MNPKRIALLAGAELLGGVLAVVLYGTGNVAAGLFQPLLAVGSVLRGLSLSGQAGNVAAWAVVLLVSALPLLWPAVRRRQGLRWEDLLLPVLAAVLLASLYLAANPSLLSGAASQFWPLAAGGTLASILVSYLLLLLLRWLHTAQPGDLASLLGRLLVAGAALLACGSVYSAVAEWLVQSAAVVQGNTGAASMAPLTGGMLAVLALLELVPSVMGACALLWGADLAVVLREDPFGQTAVERCERTAVWCYRAAQASILVSAAANLMQLLLLQRLAQVRFVVQLPLLPVLLCAALFLLCRWFRQGKQLQDDNQSII